MLQNKLFEYGKLKGTIYDFEYENDILPMHSHDIDTIHITVVARGSFKTSGNGWELIVKSGDVLDWKLHDPHEFVALEPNSRIVNIQKG